MNYNKAIELIGKLKSGIITTQERNMLEDWYLHLAKVKHLNLDYSMMEKNLIANWERINHNLPEQEAMKVVRPSKLIRRISIAASIFITVGLGIYFSINRSYKTNLGTQAITNEIVPGKNGATLTLANGKKIDLSNASNGILAKEAGIKITKSTDGQLIYEVSNSSSDNGSGELHYNTLTTARGEQYQVRLPDSSIVWLNAASALKYPSSFASLKDRVVELSGEAYFQVAKDKKHPFIVYSRGQEVKVLGTHFNINSYAEEPNVLTTLLEGSIEVSSFPLAKNHKNKVILKPRQQLQSGLDRISVLNDVELENIVAWKQGYFIFNEDLNSIMNKVARWYDVEIIYVNKPDKNLLFQGKISRSRNLSEVLKVMEYTGLVHFKVEGRRIMVTN